MEKRKMEKIENGEQTGEKKERKKKMEKRKDKITWVWCLETPPIKLK